MRIKLDVPQQIITPPQFATDKDWVLFLKRLVDAGLILGINLAELNGKPLAYSDIARNTLLWFSTSNTDFDTNPAAYPYCTMIDKVAHSLVGNADYMKWRKLGKLPLALMHALDIEVHDPDWDVNQVLQQNPIDDHPLLVASLSATDLTGLLDQYLELEKDLLRELDFLKDNPGKSKFELQRQTEKARAKLEGVRGTIKGLRRDIKKAAKS